MKCKYLVEIKLPILWAGNDKRVRNSGRRLIHRDTEIIFDDNITHKYKIVL